jgi:hypothetical protein
MHHTPFRYDCGLCIVWCAHATINLVGIARSVLCSPITCHAAKKYERNPGLSQVQEQATVRLLLFFWTLLVRCWPRTQHVIQSCFCAIYVRLCRLAFEVGGVLYD